MNLNATLFVQIVVFLIFAIFTAKVVWPPLVKVLDERSQRIADSLAAAEKSKQEVANVEAQVQAEIRKAREEGAKRIAEAEQRAGVVAADIKAQRLLNRLNRKLSKKSSVLKKNSAVKLQLWP